MGIDFVIERRPDGMHWIIFAPDSGHYYAYQERLASYAENLLWMLFEIQDERQKQELAAQADTTEALQRENASLKERNAWLEQRWEATHALLHKGE